MTGAEGNVVTQPVPVRDAATVMLVRDAPTGEIAGGALEVCMLQRRLESEFVSGAFVFPGGAVDPDDRDDGWGAHCAGRAGVEAPTDLDVDQQGLAFWVAAIRESFEECGLLPAYRVEGEPLRFDDPAVAARFADHRQALNSGRRTLAAVCEDEGLQLAVDTMHYFGRWITPPGAPRRYDTRFFLAPAPPGQQPLHDDHEVIGVRWVHPADALAQQAAGDLLLLPPTIATLRSLTAFTTADDALAAAAEATSIPTVAPRVVIDDDGARIVLPGDPGYDSAYAGDDVRPDWSQLRARGDGGTP